jgi:Abnormal spindle-like microcephaly-assoc'd, ASPM-SPD-2-Hydin
MELRGDVSRQARIGVSLWREWVFLSLSMIASLGAVSCGQIASQSAQSPASQSKIVLIPNAVDFNSVVLGQKNSQTVKMSNEDAKTVQIKSIKVAGSGFSIEGLTFPFSLEPQASRTFNVDFTPKSTGVVSGTLTIGSSLANPAIIEIKGVGTNALQKLQTSPTSINFGNLKVLGTSAQKLVVTNTGNSNITVDQVVLSGTGFVVSALATHFELAPQQETSFLVSFNPQVKGQVSGAIKFFSKDLSAPVSVSLAGNAVTTMPASSGSSHTVKLTWDASPGNISGYYVYRGEISGGPYTRVDASLVSSLEYADTGVQSGQEYFYVVTSVNNGGHESAYSTQVSVTIPSP